MTNRLRRLAHLAKEGWWSGDLHVHRRPADMELLMQAEDLHVAPVMTMALALCRSIQWLDSAGDR